MSENTEAQDRIEYLTRRAVRNIEDESRTLRNYLQGVKRDVDRALAGMAEGTFSRSASFGPIGHQAPFDLAVAQTKLSNAIDLALNLGVTPEAVQEAFDKGARTN